ncbi:sugar ABC transporter permease [Brachybacterium huguangmaarense]|uniref:Sugar ABC transporter permease n=1 Tax=Brachybacterium huguangmaarense TaxID=1652028 RepID=A0ABY6G3K4_9MICO|nr:sugar ABC transporter permease [Brachybacterium huguangmaarense]UYG17381.1 sugar ABC transporter permease [Brachybacterium huguangmaarense]
MTDATPVPTGISGASSGGRPFERRQVPLGRRLARGAAPWALLAPGLILLAVLLLWPLVRVLMLSFQDYRLRNLVRGESNYIGIENYTKILTDGFLWKTVLPNTVGFAIVCVVVTIVVGIGVALFLNTLGTVWRSICTTVVMIAWAIPALSGTYVFVWLFDPLNGLVTNLMDSLGIMDAGSWNWFTNRWAFYGIALLNVVYHGFPFIAVTVLAAVIGVPLELYEAAALDGAGAWKRFVHVTLPGIRPVLAVCVILSTIWDFKVFTQIYLMPGGDGSNRQVMNLGVWSYSESFSQGMYGMGSAIAVLLTVVLLVVSVIYMRTLLKEEEL